MVKYIDTLDLLDIVDTLDTLDTLTQQYQGDRRFGESDENNY